MSVFKNGKFYHYEFKLDGRRHRGSTGTASKAQAIAEERRHRERLEKSYTQIIEEEAREQQRKTIQQAADEFLVEYKAKHESATFAIYALGHVTEYLGEKLVVEITPTVVKRYQTIVWRRRPVPRRSTTRCCCSCGCAANREILSAGSCVARTCIPPSLWI